jgi:hypothetical protein
VTDSDNLRVEQAATGDGLDRIEHDGSEAAAARLRSALAARPWAVVRGPGLVALAGSAPGLLVERMIGQRPRMLERQPIRAVEGGRSFASSSRFTPLHTDSQLYGGAPPDLQVMACVRAAAQGGESLVLDAWRLAESVAQRDAGLFAALFDVHRRMPFVFGAVHGPTLALRAGRLVFTHSPMPPPDPVGRRLAPHLAAAGPARLAIEPGDLLLVDNLRALHGREAFEGGDREFVRLLVWLPGPLARHAAFEARAGGEAQRVRTALASESGETARRMGAPAAADRAAEARLDLVLEMLRGGAPGQLSARSGVPEPDLYRWRDAALAAALAALGEDEPAAAEAALAALVERLNRRGS